MEVRRVEDKLIKFPKKRACCSGINVAVGIKKCSDCEQLNIAMRIMKALKWRHGPDISFDSILRYDKEASEIIVDEPGLLRLIQLVNPAQKNRRIRLEGGESI
jgi:hypothetical protein